MTLKSHDTTHLHWGEGVNKGLLAGLTSFSRGDVAERFDDSSNPATVIEEVLEESEGEFVLRHDAERQKSIVITFGEWLDR